MLPGDYRSFRSVWIRQDGALRGLFSALAAADFEIAIRVLEDAALVE